MARRAVAVTLPGGLWRDGEVWRDARVRPLCGHDEEFLLAVGPELSAPARSTALLARTVERLGPDAPPGADTLEALSVGDREALLWTVRRATFGERLDLVLDCATCEGKLDVTLDVGSLVSGPLQDWQPQREEHVAGRALRYRLPTGADQEAVAGAADIDEAARELLERLVLSVDGHPLAPADIDALAEPLAARLSEVDPQAETLLEVACPGCGTATTTIVDAGAVLVEEAVRGARWLLEEVHTLAWHYHWSEDEIFSLPSARRQRYLDLVASTASGATP